MTRHVNFAKDTVHDEVTKNVNPPTNDGPVDIFQALDANVPTDSTQPKVAGRKRRRDIRSIAVFKQTVYGPKGIPRWHGMVSRNALLMYPPEEVSEMREKVLKYKKQEEELAKLEAAAEKANKEEQQNRRDTLDLDNANTDDELLALFREARARDEKMLAASEEETQRPEDARIPELLPKEKEIAQYHHKQLDTLIRLFYEFNHVTFLKLPIADTLNLLSRCGREASAHVTEFEMHQRMAREDKLNTLRELRREEAELEWRQEQLANVTEDNLRQSETARFEEISKELEEHVARLEQEETEERVIEDKEYAPPPQPTELAEEEDKTSLTDPLEAVEGTEIETEMVENLHELPEEKKEEEQQQPPQEQETKQEETLLVLETGIPETLTELPLIDEEAISIVGEVDEKEEH